MFSHRQIGQYVIFIFLMLACQPDQRTVEFSEHQEALYIQIQVANHDSIALQTAIEDVYEFVNIVNETTSQSEQQARITIQVDPQLGLTAQSYRLQNEAGDILLTAQSEIAATYGLYHILQDMGARFIHPEQTVYPTQKIVELPTYNQVTQTPRFEKRGFHEHTQHPIVMSDFLLRSGREDFRHYVSMYLKWLVRNRQNLLSFHLLNTIDFPNWLPYITEIIQEAHDYHIMVGLVTGFVDQQQNAYRLYRPDQDGSAEVQITSKLDRLLDTGLDYITFQIGTSEFTKPDENEMLAWLNLSMEHIAIQYPQVQVYTWIHIACGLEQEDGSPYYHLPLKADERIGAFVHTTMFYTLDHPAPVYECEDFTHQKDFFDQALGQRELMFFPETAWWLGFDNHVPLVNPITGRSREYDMNYLDDIGSIPGHINFTTGKEWTYWQYDHYLTQSTWQAMTWNEYLDWIAPIYGDISSVVSQMIQRWTDTQWQHLYVDHPEIYFYLSGELPQDELGEQAGIIARRPKISFKKVLQMGEAEFEQWETNDLQKLESMLLEYQMLFAEIQMWFDEAGDLLDSNPTQLLQREVYIAYHLFIQRIRHSIALYKGVVATRQQDRDMAEQHLQQAQNISEDALSSIQTQSSAYRYPDEVLTELKPDSLTAYPFGYLHETSTAYFWKRREEQLLQLIQDIFEAPPEEWGQEIQVLYYAQGEDLELTIPNNPLLENALGGFVPQVLIAVTQSIDELPFRWGIAQDANQNFQPDRNTTLWLSSDTADSMLQWQTQANSYELFVRDASGMSIGTLTLAPVNVTLMLSEDQQGGSLTLDADVTSEQMITLVTSIAGIEEEALAQLIKTIWSLPLDQELPMNLPLQATFKLQTMMK